MNTRALEPLRRCRLERVGDEIIVTDRRLKFPQTVALIVGAGVLTTLICIPGLMAGQRETFVIAAIEYSLMAVFGVAYARRVYRDGAPRHIPLRVGLRTEVVESEVRNARTLATSRTLYAHVDGERRFVMQVSASSPDYDRLPDVGRWIEDAARTRLAAPEGDEGFDELRRELGVAPKSVN